MKIILKPLIIALLFLFQRTGVSAAVPSQTDFDSTYFRTSALPISVVGNLTNYSKLGTNTFVNKAGDTMTGTLTVTGLTNSALTASRAVVSAADKSLASSATTATELGYVSGVTSAIQTQMDGKQASLGYTPVNKAGDTMTGTLLVTGLTNSARTASRFVVAAADKSDATTATSQVLIDTLSDETGSGAAVFGTSPTFTTKITLSGGTVTSDTPVIDASQTWNNAGVTFTGLKLNVTDTASAAASLLMDLQVGGSSKFKLDKAGVVTVAASAHQNVAQIRGSDNVGFTFRGSSNNQMGVQIGGASSFQFDSQGSGYSFTGAASSQIGWASTANGTGWLGAADTILLRDAANTLALRNGANAQTFNVYNTYTDASNYERYGIFWNANVLEFGTYKAGTGSSRNITVKVGGTTVMGINNNAITMANPVIFATDNTYDIGASGATRPRDYFGARHITAGGLIEAGAGNGFKQTSKGILYFESDGVLRIANVAANDIGRLQFGGTTAAFPSIGRANNTLLIQNADASAGGNFGYLMGVGDTAHLNARSAAMTNNISAAFTYVDATNGVDLVRYSGVRYFLNGSGSDQTFTIPAAWKQSKLHPAPPALTNATITKMMFDIIGPTDTAANQTNVCVSFDYF